MLRTIIVGLAVAAVLGAVCPVESSVIVPVRRDCFERRCADGTTVCSADSDCGQNAPCQLLVTGKAFKGELTLIADDDAGDFGGSGGGGKTVTVLIEVEPDIIIARSYRNLNGQACFVENVCGAPFGPCLNNAEVCEGRVKVIADPAGAGCTEQNGACDLLYWTAEIASGSQELRANGCGVTDPQVEPVVTKVRRIRVSDFFDGTAANDRASVLRAELVFQCLKKGTGFCPQP